MFLLISAQIPHPYPGPQSVLILNNCSIHHSTAVQELVEDDACMFHSQFWDATNIVCLVCKLIFLPPYSPNLNPIKQAFSCIKAFLWCAWNDFSLEIIDHACQHITPEMAWGFLSTSGYVVWMMHYCLLAIGITRITQVDAKAILDWSKVTK